MLESRRSSLFVLCVTGLLTPLLTPTLGQAASHDSLDEEDLLGGVTSVRSATRLQQKLSDTPAAVTLIDRRMIEASGAVNIADLFKLVPGFQAYHVSANQFGVVSHGQGDAHPGRMEVTIDGRSVYQPALSSVDWTALGVSLDDINYIEVVRGPNVATQGSNAFLGAINIITYTPLEQSGSAVRTTLGALGTQEYALRHNDNVGSFNYRLALNYHKNTGTGVGFDPNSGDPFYARMEDGAEISQLNLHGIYTPTLRDSLVVQLGLSDGQKGVGRTHNPAEFSDREVQANYQNLSWDRILNPQQKLRLQISHNRYEYHNESPILLSDLLIREIDAFAGAPLSAVEGFIGSVTGGELNQLVDEGSETGVTERYDLELQLLQEWNPALRLVAGAGVRHDRFTSLVNLGTSRPVSSTSPRLFGNLEWQLASDWTANLGAMLEHNPDPGARFSPRVGLNWHLSEQQTLRAAASRAYRMPSPMEQHLFAGLVLPSNGQMLDLDTYTPERLDPERIDALELGYRIEAPAIHSALDIKLYIEEMEDGIAEQWSYSAAANPDSDPDWVSAEVPATDAKQQALQLVNNARLQTQGLEVQWALQPWSHTWFFLGYAYADADGHYDRRQYNADGKISAINLAEHVPRHSVSVLASHAFGDGIDASAAWYRQTSVRWAQGADLDPYDRIDGRLAKTFQTAGMQGSLELILQSLTGSYTEFSDNNSVDKRGFVRVTLKFL